MGVVAVFAGGVASHRQLSDKEVNGVIDHADGSVTTEKIRDGAITANKLAALDRIDLAPRTNDPALAAGRVWFRSDLGLLSFSPDGSTVARVPRGTINVDSHASRHNADGADPITGWIAPSMIGPNSDTAAYMYFRTRNIAGTSSVGHIFAPYDDNWGNLGTSTKRWSTMYTSTIAVSAFANFYKFNVTSGTTNYFPYATAAHATLVPYTDGYSYIGTDTARFYYVRGVNVVAGDLVFGFEDRICPVCGREFEVGDAVVLKVYKKREDGSFAVVPVHRDCNPHPFNEELLKLHEEALKPREDPQRELEELRYRWPNPHAEFEVIAEEVIDEEHVMIRARFADGIEVAPVVRIDASWEEVVKAIRELYLREKQKLIEERERRARGEERLRRRGSWVRRRGIVELK